MINMTDMTDEFAAPAPVSVPGFHAKVATKLQTMLTTIGQAVAVSRQAEANRIVSRYLAVQGDAELVRWGFSSAEIQDVRGGTWHATSTS